MDHRQANQQNSFQSRAPRIRTRAQAKQQQQEFEQLEKERGGLTKRQYWEQRVHNTEDVVLFYRLYHPEYPEILAKAIAAKFELVLNKYNNGQQLSEEEKKMLVPYSGLETSADQKQWDPMEEIQDQMLAGKIKLTEGRLEQLMNDCN